MNKHQQVQDRLFEIEECVRRLEDIVRLILKHLGLRLVYTASPWTLKTEDELGLKYDQLIQSNDKEIENE